MISRTVAEKVVTENVSILTNNVFRDHVLDGMASLANLVAVKLQTLPT